MKLLSKEELIDLENIFLQKVFISTADFHQIIVQAKLVEPLVEALKFYADRKKWEVPEYLALSIIEKCSYITEICGDSGDKAREALKIIND